MIGLVTAVFLMWTQSLATGGWTGLLAVGESSPARSYIEESLGQTALVPADGHDGQSVFVVASDLTGQVASEVLDHPGYRFRRILYPALASLFGLLDGRLLLVSMIAWAAVAFALAVTAIRMLITRFELPLWVMLGVVLNPGIWLSLRLLTVDVLAVSLSIAGVAAWAYGRWRVAALLLLLAALTKDQFIVVSVSLALIEFMDQDRNRALWLFLLPSGALASWSLSTSVIIGRGLTPGENFTLPFEGIADALGLWSSTPGSDVLYVVVTLATVATTTFFALRLPFRSFRLIAAPWILLPLVASSSVWDFGNNAIRAFSPLIILTVGGLGVWTRCHGYGSPSPTSDR